MKNDSPQCFSVCNNPHRRRTVGHIRLAWASVPMTTTTLMRSRNWRTINSKWFFRSSPADTPTMKVSISVRTPTTYLSFVTRSAFFFPQTIFRRRSALGHTALDLANAVDVRKKPLNGDRHRLATISAWAANLANVEQRGGNHSHTYPKWTEESQKMKPCKIYC